MKSKPRAKRYTETGDYLRMLRRVTAAAGKRVGEADVEDLAELIGIQKDLDAAIGRAVAGLRDDGYTWQSIGDALGVTRQAAFMRWGPRSRPLPADSVS
jgi:hypothetical protein